jgi:peptidoglycan/LPS O-acetylase OafA/YrhL
VSGWDAIDFLGWGLLVVVVLLAAALVTYLVKSWGRTGRRRAAERAELEQLRRDAARRADT